MKHFTELSKPTVMSSIKVESGAPHCPKHKEGSTFSHGWCCRGQVGEEQFD